jgi:hypothetical protein
LQPESSPHATPNIGLEPTPYSVRCAPASRRGSGEEERRRTNVSPHLWDDASLGTLGVAGLIRGSERWGNTHYRACEPHHIRALRHTLALEPHPEAPAHVPLAAHPRRSAAAARELFQGKKDLTSASWASPTGTPPHGAGEPVRNAVGSATWHATLSRGG